MTVIITLLVIVATILPSVFLHFQLLIILVPAGLLSLYRIYWGQPKSGMKYVLLLIIMAAIVAFGTDVFYIKSFLGGSNIRFQTTHKIYMTLWVFLSIPAACSIYYVLNNPGRKRKIVWGSMLVVLVLACLVHPIATTTSVVSGDNFSTGLAPHTLDGMAWVEKHDKGDYEAIRWINDNIRGSPVILEAPGIDGWFTSRVSTFTGLPTLLGWMGVASLNRGNDRVWSRIVEMNTIYNTGNNSEALELLEKYNVKYIYIGNWEKATFDREFGWWWPRQNYSNAGLQKFAEHTEDYTLIYENESVAIYEVRE